MMTARTLPTQTEATYPESDGQPMADNTVQFRWIVTLQGGLAALFRDRADVFVAGDLLWYPVEGHPDICTAPDVMVVLGRPKEERGAYLQWREEDIAPQVVFEVLSPSNTVTEMNRKLRFYDRHGVEEYYLYDPDSVELQGWQRVSGRLTVIEPISGWVSPLLGIRFEIGAEELVVYRPNGQRFLTYVALEEQRAQAEQRAERLAVQLRALGVEPQKE